MTDRERLLAALNRPVTLQSGATVTIRAWGLDHVEQNLSDFFTFLRLFVNGIRSTELDSQPAVLGLLSRVTRASLTDPTDADLLTVADLPVLAQEIFDLNHLGDVAGGLIGLLMRAQQAVADLSEDSPPSSPT